MTLNLNTLYPSIGSKKKGKRLGRGNASGLGTYAGRGMKGQRSRSGGKGGLKLRGLKSIMLSTPKLPGFRSPYAKSQVVKLSQLESSFEAGATVDKATLLEKKLIKNTKLPVKVLNSGELTKKLIISGCLFSQAAKAKVEAAGGEIKE